MTTRAASQNPKVARAERKFLRYFKKGFQDPVYVDWERQYKVDAHERWNETLNKDEYKKLLAKGGYTEIAKRAVAIESRTNLLFSFEKMAIRDAVKSTKSAALFAKGLYDLVYTNGNMQTRFERWIDTLQQ